MGLYPSHATQNAYNSKDRKALQLGFTPQSKLGNGRLAMVKRLQRNAGITPLHTLLFPLIMLPSFPPALAV
ncbi:hypothetical protein [Nostoc sp.]|uniref:hypothetical protein n=1 Tax=Nostoc sp. TaxID=1180 RepID=UPI003FA5B409